MTARFQSATEENSALRTGIKRSSFVLASHEKTFPREAGCNTMYGWSVRETDPDALTLPSPAAAGEGGSVGFGVCPRVSLRPWLVSLAPPGLGGPGGHGNPAPTAVSRRSCLTTHHSRPNGCGQRAPLRLDTGTSARAGRDDRAQLRSRTAASSLRSRRLLRRSGGAGSKLPKQRTEMGTVHTLSLGTVPFLLGRPRVPPLRCRSGIELALLCFAGPLLPQVLPEPPPILRPGFAWGSRRRSPGRSCGRTSRCPDRHHARRRFPARSSAPLLRIIHANLHHWSDALGVYRRGQMKNIKDLLLDVQREETSGVITWKFRSPSE